jgi:hypothetical protein
MSLNWERSSTVLSKSHLIAFRQCPKRLWLETYRPEFLSEAESNQSIMEEGLLVGKVALDLFPGGLLIEGAIDPHGRG